MSAPVLVLGQTYVATPTPHNVQSCAGCAATSPKLLASEKARLCGGMPPCFSAQREDGRNVVWVAAQATTPEV